MKLAGMLFNLVDGGSVWIRAMEVVAIRAETDNSNAVIYVTSGDEFYVKMTLQDAATALHETVLVNSREE